MAIIASQSNSPVEAAEKAERRAGYLFILGFTVLSLGIITGGISYYRHYEQQFRSGTEGQPSGFAERKADGLEVLRQVKVSETPKCLPMVILRRGIGPDAHLSPWRGPLSGKTGGLREVHQADAGFRLPLAGAEPVPPTESRRCRPLMTLQPKRFNLQVTGAGKRGSPALKARSRDGGGGVEGSIFIRTVLRCAMIGASGSAVSGMLAASAS